MKKVFYLLLIGAAVGLLLLPTLRREHKHIRIVEFVYSRTMEFKRTKDANRMTRLREVSLRSLRSLFDDWKFGSLTGEVPLFISVRRKFLAMPNVLGKITEECADDFLRATRFEIVDARANELPVKCRLIVDTGVYDAAEALAKTYVECIGRFIQDENENWAFKANLEKINALQRLEDEQASMRKRLKSTRQGDPENQRIRKEIAANEARIDTAKLEMQETIRKYREIWDCSLVFLDHVAR